MANSSQNSSDLDYADTLWKAADALRGQVDAAPRREANTTAKHVVLGLLFLKYISDSFESRRDDLRAELTADGITRKQLDSLLESRDEYTAERVFWVPLESRYSNLQNQATLRLAHMNLASTASRPSSASSSPTRSSSTSTPTSRPTSSSPTRCSTSLTGPASSSATPATPESNTSSTTSPVNSVPP